MFTRTGSVNIEGRPQNGTYSKSKARRGYLKMPILADLSRRFHMLTTDAKPDPPRVEIQDYTHNLRPPASEDGSKTKTRSAPVTPEKQRSQEDVSSLHRQKSMPNGAVPIDRQESEYGSTKENIGDSRPSGTESREYKKPTTKTRTKAKQSKHSQGANVVNYNIINSNGVKIGARTSYICNVNQYSTSNATSPETPSTKPKSRPMPEEVDALTTCDEEITFEDMFLIKTHIGHGWRHVARRLAYSEGQIDQFEENYRQKGVDEVIYQLLLDWKQANTKDAQVRRLINALWSCQEYDCAERWSTERNISSA